MHALLEYETHKMHNGELPYSDGLSMEATRSEKQVTYLEPAQVSEVEVINGSNVNVKATHGLVLRPPWQRLENRYLVSSPQGQSTLYYEPYCVYDQNSLGKECVDIIITPAVKKFLPKFTLVSEPIKRWWSWNSSCKDGWPDRDVGERVL
ncbi:hypothetical protein LINPERPRIM_LOCUS41200 [Linum perenne]